MDPVVEISAVSFPDFTDGLTLNQMRPYIGKDGLAYVSVPTQGKDGKMVLRPQVIVNSPQLASNAATLRHEEWLYMDSVVQEIYQRPRVGIQDLINAGLTLDFDGYASTVLGFEDISDIGDANIDMDGETERKGDAIEYDTKYLPLPIIHKGFSLNDRQLQMSRKLGVPLDTTMLGAVANKINDFRENMLFNGSSTFKFGGGTIYGYLDYPSAGSVTLQGCWDTLGTASGVTGETILEDVQNMIQAMILARCYGPWMLYCPDTWEMALSSDYKANSDKTIRQRIKELSPQLIDVKTSAFLSTASCRCVMVQMKAETIRLVRGMALTTVQWQVRKMGRHNFKLMMIEVPQIRTDQAERAGIIIGSV